MNSLKDILESKEIMLSLHFYGLEDLATSWEVKSIVENLGVFDNLYSRLPLSKLSNLDDYYYYLFSCKLIRMREVIPLLLQEEHKVIISKLSDNAEQAISCITTGDVIGFINNNIQEIFDEEKTSHDIRSVTFDFIAKHISGIQKETLAFLCMDYGYLLIDRFAEFEKFFEQYPDLFESIYRTGHLEEIDSYRLEKTLDIWCHILNKKKSNLKEIVVSRITVLAEDVGKLCDTATIDNIMQVEGTIRKFHLFLQRIHNPMANKFAGCAKTAEALLSKYILEQGQSFEYKIPVVEIIDRWKETKIWEIRLLSITHDLKSDDDTPTCVSRLSRSPEVKRSLLDLVSTNVPTDDYFTMSHQQMLSIISSIGTGTMVGIIQNPETLLDYMNLVASALSFIIEQLNAEEEQLLKDFKMFSAMVHLVASNSEINIDVMHGMCFGASMYMCALSEKLMRILYVHLAKDELYIPINKATFGELLVVSNPYMLSVFGENHIRNLSFFLQRISPSNIGQNIRNSLAHWSNVSTEAMTPNFMAKVLWLFTDILNTVFWYCLQQ